MFCRRTSRLKSLAKIFVSNASLAEGNCFLKFNPRIAHVHLPGSQRCLCKVVPSRKSYICEKNLVRGKRDVLKLENSIHEPIHRSFFDEHWSTYHIREQLGIYQKKISIPWLVIRFDRKLEHGNGHSDFRAKYGNKAYCFLHICEWYKYETAIDILEKQVKVMEKGGSVQREGTHIYMKNLIDLYYYLIQKQLFNHLKNVEKAICENLNQVFKNDELCNVDLLEELFILMEFSAAIGKMCCCKRLCEAIFSRISISENSKESLVFRTMFSAVIYHVPHGRCISQQLLSYWEKHSESLSHDIELLLHFFLAFSYKVKLSEPTNIETAILKNLVDTVHLKEDHFWFVFYKTIARDSRFLATSKALQFQLGMEMSRRLKNNDQPRQFLSLKFSLLARLLEYYCFKCKTYHVPLMRSCEHYIKHSSKDVRTLRTKDISSIVRSLGCLGYDKGNVSGLYTHLLHLFEESWQGRSSKLKWSDQFISLINLLEGLAYVEIFPKDLLNQVFQPGAISLLIDGNPKEEKVKMWEFLMLQACIDIEYTDYKGQMLSSETMEYIFDIWLKACVYNEVKMSGVVNRWLSTLNKHCSENAVHYHRILPYQLFRDIEVRLDEKDSPISFDPVPYTEMIKPGYWESQANVKRRIAIMFSHCYEHCIHKMHIASKLSTRPWKSSYDDSDLKGLYATKRRHLEKLGYDVYVVKIRTMPARKHGPKFKPHYMFEMESSEWSSPNFQLELLKHLQINT